MSISKTRNEDKGIARFSWNLKAADALHERHRSCVGVVGYLCVRCRRRPRVPVSAMPQCRVAHAGPAHRLSTAAPDDDTSARGHASCKARRAQRG